MYALPDAPAVEVRSETFIRDESRKYLRAAVADAQKAGLSPEQVRFRLRRAYCWELPRKGRSYKIWRREMLAIEAELGLAPKRHKNSKADFVKKEAAALTQADIDKAEPVTKEQAAKFLRRRCKAALFMLEDSDQLRVTLKATDILENPIKWEYRAELLCDDAADYDDAFISAAHAAWTVWSELESTKL